MSKIAVMAFSGGMDSTGLLVHLLANDFEVHTLSYDYGQKHKLELDRAKANIAYLSENNIKVTQRIVDLQSAMSIFHSALTTEDYAPWGEYAANDLKTSDSTTSTDNYRICTSFCKELYIYCYIVII